MEIEHSKMIKAHNKTDKGHLIYFESKKGGYYFLKLFFFDYGYFDGLWKKKFNIIHFSLNEGQIPNFTIRLGLFSFFVHVRSSKYRFFMNDFSPVFIRCK